MPGIADLSRVLTNHYTRIFEKSPRKVNTPFRIALNQRDRLIITETAPVIDAYIPEARYYEDLTLVGGYTEANGFDGTGYVKYSSAILEDTAGLDEFWIVVAFQPDWAPADLAVWPILFECAVDGSNRIVLTFDPTTDEWAAGVELAGVFDWAKVSATHAANDHVQVALRYKAGSYIRVSVDGGAWINTNTTKEPGLGSDVWLGKGDAGQYQASGTCDWVLAGVGDLTDDDLAALAALGSADLAWADVPSIYVSRPSFLWDGVDENHTPTALYGENWYEV